MKRPSSHVTEDQADRLLRAHLPPAWTINRHEKDYGIDYSVQVFENNHSTPFEFDIQLKGTARPILHDGVILHKMDCENLRDYMERRRPIFLVICDTVNHQCHYVFIQQHLTDIPDGWHKKRRIQIRVPIKNKISEHDALAIAVRESDRYMARLRPASLEDAIEFAEKQIRTKDPRFSVQLESIKNKCRHFTISPKSPVEFHLTIPAEKASSLIDKGQPTHFKPGELVIEGSPLLEEMTNSEVLLHFKREVEATLVLMEENESKTLIGTIPTAIELGTSEYRVVAELESGLLSLKFSGSIVNPNRSNTMHLSSELSSWKEMNIYVLPYLDLLSKMTDAISRKSNILFNIEHKGNTLISGRLLGKELTRLEVYKRYFDTLKKWRDICKLLRLNATCPTDMTHDDIDAIEMAHFILMTPYPSRPTPRAAFNLSITRDGLQELILKEDIFKPSSMGYNMSWSESDLLGVSFHLHSLCGNIAITLSNMVLQLSKNQLLELLNDTSEEIIKLAFHATDTTIQSVKKEFHWDGAEKISLNHSSHDVPTEPV